MKKTTQEIENLDQVHGMITLLLSEKEIEKFKVIESVKRKYSKNPIGRKIEEILSSNSYSSRK